MEDRSFQTPVCIGFIMDGNRRWAKEKEKKIFDGHKAGEDTFYKSVQWVRSAGISNAVYYAFSTENWRRSPSEVSSLMELLEMFLKRMLSEIHDLKIGVKVIGRRKDFSDKLQNLFYELEKSSSEYIETVVWVALSYGGRTEILEAVNKAVEKGKKLDEENFSNLLWTAGMPDPDLIIRTGGEHRLSNFLPWQSIYSELFFTRTYWPAFTKDEFEGILSAYAERERRIGK